MSFDIAEFTYGRNRSGPPASQSRYFRIRLRGETIGLPVDCVSTVFHVDAITPVPLAPPEVAGLVNLRGRIVTALHLGRCLWLDQAMSGADGLAVGVEHGGEKYALLIDDTDDVVAADETDRINCPAHMDPRLAELMAGCYRLHDDFLTVLDIGALLRRVMKLSEATQREGRHVLTRGSSA